MTAIKHVGIVKMEQIVTVLLGNAAKDVKNIGMERTVTVKIKFILCFYFLYLNIYLKIIEYELLRHALRRLGLIFTYQYL